MNKISQRWRVVYRRLSGAKGGMVEGERDEGSTGMCRGGEGEGRGV